MLSRGGLDDDVDIAMKGIGRQGRDGVDVGDVRPDLGIQSARFVIG